MCELDIIFNFEKAYFILDEFLMGGEIQETSKQTVNRCIEASDMLQEVMRTRTLTRVQHNTGSSAVCGPVSVQPKKHTARNNQRSGVLNECFGVDCVLAVTHTLACVG